MELYKKNHKWRASAKSFVIKFMKELGFDWVGGSDIILFFFNYKQNIRVKIGYPNSLETIVLTIYEEGKTQGWKEKTTDIQKAIGLPMSTII